MTTLRRVRGHWFLMLVSGIALPAQPPQSATAAKTGLPAPTADNRPRSAEAMQVSIDKQKAAVRLQVGEGGPAASFFTTPWLNPSVPPLVAQGLAAPPPQCEPMEESDLAPLVKEAALAQDMSAGLIRAVIRRESASLACAVSDKGAVGLMQLMPETAVQFGVDPYDPKQNVQTGAKYLKQLITRYKGDISLALAAYNAGPARVDQAAAIPAIPETAAYVEAILRDMESENNSASVAPPPERE